MNSMHGVLRRESITMKTAGTIGFTGYPVGDEGFDSLGGD